LSEEEEAVVVVGGRKGKKGGSRKGRERERVAEGKVRAQKSETEMKPTR
jgi:hypothetical protein